MNRSVFTLIASVVFSHKIFAIPEYRVDIRNHLFTPSKIVIPSGEKVRLVITNYDPTPEEFDSFDLNREKVIFAKRSASIYIGPLEPGEYHFFGEYHPEQARGKVVAQPTTEERQHAH